MLEPLCTYHGVLFRHRAAPLAQERERSRAARAAVGLAPDTLRTFAHELRMIAQTLALPAHGPLDAATLKVAAQRWGASQHPGHQAQDWQGPRRRCIRVAPEWLRFLDRFAAPAAEAPPCAVLIAACATDMPHERGLSSKTIGNYPWFPRQVCQCFRTPERPCSDGAVGDVEAFLSGCGQRWGRVSVATAAKALRAFFRHAEHRQWCAAGIAAAIESPRLFQQEPLPLGPTWAEVQQLLAQTRTDHPRDSRHQAIWMLFALYGLRSGEVAARRLEQLDWAHEQITIGRPKQHGAQVYPLTQAMGTALLRYLRDVRPRCERRAGFVTLRAPWRSLSAGALHHLTRTRLPQVGYGGPPYGPPTLRHACAAPRVARNLSRQEIGDYLGQRSPYATRTDAKVEGQRLREVARFAVGALL